MIHRKQSRPSYTVISNEVMGDARLSYKAKGILLYLLSKPDNWQANAQDIANNGSEGLAAVRSGINELREAGYMQLVQGGPQGGSYWDVAEWPKFADGAILRNAENPTFVKPESRKTRVSENRRVISTDTKQVLNRNKETAFLKGVWETYRKPIDNHRTPSLGKSWESIASQWLRVLKGHNAAEHDWLRQRLRQNVEKLVKEIEQAVANQTFYSNRKDFTRYLASDWKAEPAPHLRGTVKISNVSTFIR